MILAFASLCLAASLSSYDAITTVLNTPSATSPRRFQEAKRVLAADAKAGKPLQQFLFALMTDDKSLAKGYLEASRERIRAMAEKKNNSLAWYLLSMETNDMTLLRKAADGGNPQALNALGSILVQQALADRKLPKEKREEMLREGFKAFVRAATMEDANALINLGTCYQRGYGTPCDPALGFESFKMAAEKGHPEGMDYMSACFQFGHGVKADDERSLYWKMRGRSARGDEAAAKWLRDRK